MLIETIVHWVVLILLALVLPLAMMFAPLCACGRTNISRNDKKKVTVIEPHVHKLRPSYDPRHTVVCLVCGATDPDRPDGCEPNYLKEGQW